MVTGPARTHAGDFNYSHEMRDATSVVALLGPTNTGKTHRAIERMLEHHSGMMGLPLRLLAREVYDRVSVRVGEQQVALITGEEKRIGARARYWICTVEAMPVDKTVDFVGIDEVQLAAHHQRGHVFTDRLLHARGRLETWFMGADTMRPMMEELVPTAEIQRHPRLSKLAGAGATSLGSMPPRSALIAFSAAEVYTLAERIRRRRGGTAVVMGALSPRTRNAQVAMYQAGEVDFLVATDAIGMGLNMDVDHVAFAALRKFDGVRYRRLQAAEMAQIAGRAGRHTRDGTFGTVNPIELDPDAVFAIESHRFQAVKRVMWRNSDLDTSSLEALLESLGERPRRRALIMADDADDAKVLRLLAARDDIRRKADGPDGVRLLWDVCRIPDFRKLLAEHHATLLAEIFLQLAGPKSRIDPGYMHERISRLENATGDIDTLLMRMEFIRTWNYIAHHGAWVDDAASWQVRTQRAEDRLSEALHDALTSRFVETKQRRRRSRGRASKPKRSSPGAVPEPTPSGPFAELAGLRDKLRDAEAVDYVADELVEAIVEAPHDAFSVTSDAAVLFEDERVAQLTRGGDLQRPEVKLTADELAAGGRARVLRRIRAFARDFVEDTLAPLRDERLATLSAAGRGLLYQLEQTLGSVTTKAARAQLRALSADDRVLLGRVSIIIGARFVYAERLLAPDSIERRVALCHAFDAQSGFAPEGTAVSLPLPRKARGNRSDSIVAASGFHVLGARAIRIDIVEQLEAIIAEQTSPFSLPPSVPALLACCADEAERAITALGYPQTADGFVKPKSRAPKR